MIDTEQKRIEQLLAEMCAETAQKDLLDEMLAISQRIRKAGFHDQFETLFGAWFRVRFPNIR